MSRRTAVRPAWNHLTTRNRFRTRRAWPAAPTQHHASSPFEPTSPHSRPALDIHKNVPGRFNCSRDLSFHQAGYTFQCMERGSTPTLLPILRSRQQGEILTYLLCDPDHEISVSDLAHRVRVPISSAHREVERAEAAGIVTSRRVGNTRLVSADTSGPYFEGLSDILVKAFGPPLVLAEALEGVGGIESAYVYGSWAARLHGVAGRRPVNDIDMLVTGEPDRGELYEALSGVEERLGRPVNVVIRDAGWLRDGSGSFHATVTARPVVAIEIKNSLGTDPVPQRS